MTKRRILIGLVLLANSFGRSAAAQTTTKIVDHGPDGGKLVFVVLGDGYAGADQSKFKDDVNRLVVNGVFGHDFYKDNINAFNVYRVDLVSKESGISTPKYKKNTALKVIFTGDWNSCWLEESPSTDTLVTNAISVSKYDYVLIVANVNKYGGCRRGSRLYITSGDTWDVVGHEYGHGIAGLYDEYSVAGKGKYSAEPLNDKNCSVVLNRNNVVWSSLIGEHILLPSDHVPNINPNDTVGEFTGCDYAETGIYRPVQDCRMNSNTPHFCPVCLGLMKEAVGRYLGNHPAAAPPPPGAPADSNKYVNMVVRVSRHNTVAVEKATEISGQLVLAPQAEPAYFAAFTKGDQPSIANLLVEDPYVVRGFADPEHKEKGELIRRAEFATIILHVPRTSLQSATHGLGLELYRVKPGTMLGVTPSQMMDFKGVVATSEKNNVEKVMEMPASNLGKQIDAVAPEKHRE
jgi:IgA Peptidase M64